MKQHANKFLIKTQISRITIKGIAEHFSFHLTYWNFSNKLYYLNYYETWLFTSMISMPSLDCDDTSSNLPKNCKIPLPKFDSIIFFFLISLFSIFFLAHHFFFKASPKPRTFSNKKQTLFIINFALFDLIVFWRQFKSILWLFLF